MSKKKQLVSILIPVYERELYIESAIISALNQSYKNIEIIVVDNASKDNTWDICEKYAKLDNRVKIYRNDTNIGPVENWRRCFQYATGYFGKILWSDDEMDSDYVAKALGIFKDNIAFVYSSVIISSAYDKEKQQHYKFGTTGLYSTERFINMSLRNQGLPVSPGCAIFRLDDLRKNLTTEIESPIFNDFYKNGAGPDLLLFLLTANKYKEFGYIDEPLSFFREHADSISISMKKNDLYDRYLQTRLWYAKKYCSYVQMENIILYAFIERTYVTREKLSFATFVKKFGLELINFNILNFIIVSFDYLFKKLYNKIK